MTSARYIVYETVKPRYSCARRIIDYWFDDIQAAAFVEPPLTTMAQDFKEMGKLAGEVLLQTMQQDLQIIEDIQVPVTLIERETISTVSK